MRVNEPDTPLIYLEVCDGHEAGPIHWIPVLRAVLYDQMGRPGDAVPYWHRVRREIADRPGAWALREVRDVLGELPPSSQLFEPVQGIPGDTGKRPD